MSETLKSIDEFHAWLLRLKRVGVPVAFTHSWRSLPDELASAKQAIAKFESLNELTWNDLRRANLSTPYICCLLSWLKNPDPSSLEPLITCELARYQYRRSTTIAWVGALIIACVGIYAFFQSVLLLLPQYQRMGVFLDFERSPVLCLLVPQSVWGLAVGMMAIVASLICVALYSIRIAFRSKKLETKADNLLLSQTALADERLSLDDLQSEQDKLSRLQIWAIRASTSTDPSQSVPHMDAIQRRRFSYAGHQLILQRFVSRAIASKSIQVGVIIGGCFALLVGVFTFGAVADLIILVAGE